jgi:hypothetical protein
MAAGRSRGGGGIHAIAVGRRVGGLRTTAGGSRCRLGRHTDVAEIRVEDKQPTRRSLGERVLGNQVGREVVGEVMALHARMVLQSPCARRPPE